MNEPASDVIAARRGAQVTLTPTLVWSLAAHVALVAAIWLAPSRSSNQTPRLVMTVSLGGAPGPKAGGLTQMGGREVPPTPEPPKPTPRPPAPPPSRSVAALPSPKAAPARPSRAETTRTAPSTPEPPREGSTRVETGARGQGFGLSTGGNGSKSIEAEVSDFCCPAYLEIIRIAVERAWVRVPGATGSTIMRFRILRNGTIDSISMIESSRNQQIDASAARALASVPIVPPLPQEFRENTLALRLRFENR